MRGENWQACVKWGIRAIWLATLGAVTGAIVGLVWAMISGGRRVDLVDFPGLGAFFGSVALAAIPAAVAAWFLVLHMLWQVGRALRGTDNKR